jgi:hypothetical protein
MHPTTHVLYALLRKLDRARTHDTLARIRDDAVMVCATVPGRRYEIEVFSDGTVEVELFCTDGRIGGHELVDDLLAKFSDGPESTA